jgi:hypothetical protein
VSPQSCQLPTSPNRTCPKAYGACPAFPACLLSHYLPVEQLACPSTTRADLLPAAAPQDLSWSKPAQKWEAILEALVTGDKAATDPKKDRIVTPVQERDVANATAA